MSVSFYEIPNPILIDILEIPEELSKKSIKRIYEIGDIMNKDTNVKADMSNYNLHRTDKTFTHILDRISEKIFSEYPLHYCLNLDFYKKDDYYLLFEDVWSAIYRSGDYAIKHNHLSSHISFCFYLQTDEHSSPLIFDDINLEIKPKKNQLIVFPSSINHSVMKQSELGIDRILLAGNILLPIKK